MRICPGSILWLTSGLLVGLEAGAMPLSPAEVMATGRPGPRQPYEGATLEEVIDLGMRREYDGVRYILTGAPDYRETPGVARMVWGPYEAKGWRVEAVYEGAAVSWVFTPASGGGSS